jgi:hypothetical protein
MLLLLPPFSQSHQKIPGHLPFFSDHHPAFYNPYGIRLHITFREQIQPAFIKVINPDRDACCACPRVAADWDETEIAAVLCGYDDCRTDFGNLSFMREGDEDDVARNVA